MKSILPPETLVDVVATNKLTNEKTTKQMTLSEYLKLKSSKFHYQAFQVGFLNYEK